MPGVAVILCTHNPREDALNRVLEGLRAQTLPAEYWEFVIVDNGSKVPVGNRFDISWHPAGRHVLEGNLGLTPARLRGIRETSAEVLVFVDDDTVLAPDYLEQAVAVGSRLPVIGAWGGSVMPEYEIPLPQWVGSEVWRLTVFEVAEDVWGNIREGFSTIPVGAGMCVRRIVANHFEQLCRRRIERKMLDRAGTALSGYGDADLAYCAIDLGMGTGRFTSLRLTHLIPASRLTLDYFVRHAEGDASSLMIFRALRGLPIQEPGRMTAFAKLRWFLHRLGKKIPREQFEIQTAHHRGAARGYRLARELLSQRETAEENSPR